MSICAKSEYIEILDDCETTRTSLESEKNLDIYNIICSLNGFRSIVSTTVFFVFLDIIHILCDLVYDGAQWNLCKREFSGSKTNEFKWFWSQTRATGTWYYIIKMPGLAFRITLTPPELASINNMIPNYSSQKIARSQFCPVLLPNVCFVDSQEESNILKELEYSVFCKRKSTLHFCGEGSSVANAYTSLC